MTGGRRVCALVASMLVAGGLALPAGAEQAPATQPLHALPGVAVAATADGRLIENVTVHGALTALRRHANIRAWLAGTAAAVQAASGAHDRPAPLLLAPQEDVELEPGPIEAFPDFALAGSGGDLDGDGLDDVLALRGDDEDVTLQARRGTDGELLWSRGLADGDGALAYPLGVDLTGDGVDDLLSHVVTGVGTVTIEDGGDQSSYRYSATIQHRITAHSGRDGQPVWHRLVDSSIEESATSTSGPGGVTYDQEYALAATSLAVLPLLTDDLTGDGLPDVVVNEIDLDIQDSASGVDAVVAGAVTVEGTLNSSTRAVTLSGRDGGQVRTLEAADQSGISMAVPVGDLVGSTAGDLAWTTELIQDLSVVCAGALVAGDCINRSTGPTGVELEVLDGATGQPAWSTTTQGAFPFAFPLGVDADADGADDLGLLVDTAEAGRLLVVSGDDGRTLWQAEGALPFPVGFARGDDRRLVAVVADVELSFSTDLTSATAEVKTVLSRHDAADGEVLSTDSRQTTATAEAGESQTSGFIGLALSAAQDADGDARDELVTSAFAEVAGFDDQGGQSSHDARSQAWVEDLGTGRLLLDEANDDVRLLSPIGDLDGDGLLDLERIVFGADPFGPAEVTAFRVVDGGPLWVFSGDLFNAPYLAGDHDGRPGLELLHVSAQDSGDPQVASLRGGDLQERWRAPVRG